MARRARRRGRSWVRRTYILDALRRQIVRGYYPPATQMPTRDELEKKFTASRVTIQRAFHVLIREGYVTTHRRLGTFVSVTPPHLYRYVVALPMDAGDAGRGAALHRALARRAEEISREGPRALWVFEGLRGPADVERFAMLNEDVVKNRVAGVLFVGDPAAYRGAPAFDVRRFPRVAVTRAPTGPDLPRIELDRPSFFDLAVERLRAQGRSRAALVTGGDDWPADLACFARRTAGPGLTSRPAWTHPVPPGQRGAVRYLVQLMMQADADRRPDGLVLTEEGFVRDALAGLRAAGVRAGRDVEVIVQNFFPSRPATSLPLHRIGYDVDELFELCFARIDAQRQGRRDFPESAALAARVPPAVVRRARRAPVAAPTPSV